MQPNTINLIAKMHRERAIFVTSRILQTVTFKMGYVVLKAMLGKNNTRYKRKV